MIGARITSTSYIQLFIFLNPIINTFIHISLRRKCRWRWKFSIPSEIEETFLLLLKDNNILLWSLELQQSHISLLIFEIVYCNLLEPCWKNNNIALIQIDVRKSDFGNEITWIKKQHICTTLAQLKDTREKKISLDPLGAYTYHGKEIRLKIGNYHAYNKTGKLSELKMEWNLKPKKWKVRFYNWCKFLLWTPQQKTDLVGKKSKLLFHK